MAADQLDDGVGLRDLGEVLLPSLARPERVYQLTHPRFEGDFPAPPTGVGPRTNLPNPLTAFVGREDGLAGVTRALRDARVVTLAGPGKTTLAVHTARAGAYPDGAWFVDLAPLRDPALVAAQVAAAVGLDPGGTAAPGRTVLDALCEGLRQRSLLVVLDNCERVVDAAAELVHALLARCPGVAVLATSREVLGVPGERVIRVAGLSLPPRDDLPPVELAGYESVRLFCRRAAEATPGFALTDTNAEAVARICRRLDSIPLALELAAARTRLLGAHQLAARLDRLEVLSGGPRTAEPRHRALTATIGWSYDLLPEPERVLLRRLAVFPASWTPSAAEAVGAKDSGDVDGPAPGEAATHSRPPQ